MVRHIYMASNLIDGLNKPSDICDWPYQNQSKLHIWYFENYQFEIINLL